MENRWKKSGIRWELRYQEHSNNDGKYGKMIPDDDCYVHDIKTGNFAGESWENDDYDMQ